MKFKNILEKAAPNFQKETDVFKDSLRDSLGKSLDIEYILEKDINNLYGYEFYKILTVLELDLNIISRKAFANVQSKPSRTKKENSKLTRIQRFVYQFIIEQKDFADSAGIDPTRLSKLLKGDRKDFFAFEVYSIAVSQGISAANAFDQLYSNVTG